MASQSLQQQLNEMTEKYNVLQQKTKLLELEKVEYVKEFRKLSVKDDESEFTIHELIREKSETEQQHALLYSAKQASTEMLENEYDTNQELRLKLQENLKKVNKLSKENEVIKQINQKYEHELKNTNENYEKIIKLENENKNKTAEIQFLSEELQMLQLSLANNYGRTSTSKQPVLTIDHESAGPSSPLISQKTPGFTLDISSVPSNNINKMRMFDVSPDINNKTQFAYAFANINKGDTGTCTLRSNVSFEVEDDYDNYNYNYNVAIDSEHNNEVNEGFKEAMNKQRIEYEILFQSLNDENEKLNCNIKTLNVEKNELVRKYNILVAKAREIKLNIKKGAQNKSSWIFLPCFFDKI